MNPYQSLDSKHFWSTAVAKRNMFDISDLWNPKFKITQQMKVVTFGSCFAQHIGRALSSRDYNWFITEPAPQGLSEEHVTLFNFNLFSARTGNIYTTSLLKQWVEWAVGDSKVPGEVWEKNGRFYDPFRPNIEPDGFESEEEMSNSRNAAIEAFKTAVTDSEIFVFTLGLTESWFNSEHGYEYPICPGTSVGLFDPEEHQFMNQEYGFIHKNLHSVIRTIKGLNPKIKFILTVSPVPLTATMSGNHVLLATMESKSILRAVAGSLAKRFPFVDYFPSYEIINATPYRGTFFETNQRSVNKSGVNHVMSNFFDCLYTKFPSLTVLPRTKAKVIKKATRDDICDEELLNAFASGAKNAKN